MGNGKEGHAEWEISFRCYSVREDFFLNIYQNVGTLKIAVQHVSALSGRYKQWRFIFAGESAYLT